MSQLFADDWFDLWFWYVTLITFATECWKVYEGKPMNAWAWISLSCWVLCTALWALRPREDRHAYHAVADVEPDEGGE